MLNGKRRTVYGKTRAEAARKLNDLKAQAGQSGGALPDPGRQTVGDLLDAWISASAPTWKPRRTADVRHYCDAHIRPTIGKVRLSKLTPAAVQSFYNSLKSTPPSTAWAIHRALHRACRLGVLWGWLGSNPCDRVLPPSYKPGRKEPWSGEQLAIFLAGTAESRYHALWVFLVGTGCRLGEAVALRWQDVDLDAGTVCIARTAQKINGEWIVTAPKTPAGARTLAVPNEVVIALRRQRARTAERRLRAGANWCDLGLVFSNDSGGYLSFSTVEWAMSTACKRLGLPPLTPHGLRHLHASLLLHEGLSLPEVSRRLGHANTQITAAVYSHALGADDSRAAAAIGRALAGGAR